MFIINKVNEMNMSHLVTYMNLGISYRKYNFRLKCPHILNQGIAETLFPAPFFSFSKLSNGFFL